MTHFLIDIYFGLNLYIVGYNFGVNKFEVKEPSDFVLFIILGLFGSAILIIGLIVDIYLLIECKIYDALLKSDSWWIPLRTIYFVYLTKQWDHNPEFMPDAINPKIEAARQGGWRKKLLYNAMITIRDTVSKNSTKWPYFSRDHFSKKNIDPDENIEHVASIVRCDLCNKEWAAVRPTVTDKLECPNCHNIFYFSETGKELP